MSTDYYLSCTVCKKTSEFAFSRQAWGWGGADIINTFRFLMYHADNCNRDLMILTGDSLDMGGGFHRFSEEDVDYYFPFSHSWRGKDESHEAWVKRMRDSGEISERLAEEWLK
jgi:hypothetical protein